MTSKQFRSLYSRWNGIKQRCYNKKLHNFSRYGGSGITVCKRWLKSFDDFASDVGCPPDEKMMLDRIDNNGNYEPSNVRWVTPRQSSANRSNVTNLTIKGKTQNASDWSRETGISYAKIVARYRAGLSDDEILDTTPAPPRPPKPPKQISHRKQERQARIEQIRKSLGL